MYWSIQVPRAHFQTAIIVPRQQHPRMHHAVALTAFIHMRAVRVPPLNSDPQLSNRVIQPPPPLVEIFVSAARKGQSAPRSPTLRHENVHRLHLRLVLPLRLSVEVGPGHRGLRRHLLNVPRQYSCTIQLCTHTYSRMSSYIRKKGFEALYLEAMCPRRHRKRQSLFCGHGLRRFSSVSSLLLYGLESPYVILNFNGIWRP
jgi:hypothetical protein